AQINLLESLRVHIARTGGHVTTICPGFVRTDLTAGNPFPMPFIIDADRAARSICDGLERDRTEIIFPARMALLMKAARLVPARAWTALWARPSLARTPPRPLHPALTNRSTPGDGRRPSSPTSRWTRCSATSPTSPPQPAGT